MHAVRLLAAVALGLGCGAVAMAASREPPPGASACSGCHPAKSGVDTPVPRLAGRAVVEIVAQMRAFKAGQRPGTVMDRIAKGLTDAEIEAIAQWYAEQK